MTDTKNETEAKNAKMDQQLNKMDQENNHAAEQNATGGGCARCNKSGDFFLLPLRYSIIGKNENNNKPQPTDRRSKNVEILPLGHQLGQGVAELSLQSAEYNVRMLRAGYLYILVEKQEGEASWRAFQVTKEGALFESDPKDMKEDFPEFSCDMNTDGVNAACVAFEKIATIKALYLLFNPNILTERKLDYYKTIGKSTLQCIVPQAKSQQPHAIAPDDLPKQVAEFSLSALFNTPFYQGAIQEYRSYLSLADGQRGDTFTALKTFVAHSVYEEESALQTLSAYTNQLYPMEKFMDSLGRYQGLVSQLEKHNGIGFVLHDPIGITQELCNWRNDAVESTIQPWLEQEDQYKVKNSQKLQALGLIEKIESSFVNNRAWGGYNSYEQDIHDQYKEALEEYGKKFPNDKQRVEDILDDSAKSYKETYLAPQIKEEIKSGKYNTQFATKYLKYLDADEMQKFKQETENIEQDAQSAAAKRTTDLMLWLSSANTPLLAGLSFYDECYDDGNLSQGINFSHQTGLCILGLMGSREGNQLLNQWWAEKTVTPANLCWRSYCHNNQLAIDEIKSVMTQVYSQSSDGEEKSASSSAAKTFDEIVSYSKMLPDFFDKLNAYIAAENRIGGVAPLSLVWITTQGRALLGASISSNQNPTRLFRLLNFTLRASLGRRAVALRMREQPGINANMYRGQFNRRITEGLQSLSNAHQCNYYRLRLTTTIGFLESGLLLLRAYQLPKDSREYAMLVSSAMLTTSAMLEFFALGQEVILGHYGGGTLIRVTDVRFGQVKLMSAGLGTVAGVISAYWDILDAVDSFKYKRGELVFLYGIRSIGTLALVTNQMGIAIGLAEPWFARLLVESQAGNRVGFTLFYQLLHNTAMRYATEEAQALLMRRVSWLTLFIIATTGLIWVFSDTELEAWMKKCCFRLNKEQGNGYSDASKEYEAAMMILVTGEN
ncbi:T6SS effector BTH_I2691 family protein [Pragia fontium]|uniref:Toxin VasX N-terminal region domain-containing protein n=1 Tax=Pragia fontium DSM 5563 = ATCC 49100 TaxID=1122977 RepID=A0AAJ4WDU0_9GAMM|nr:T6SS effector BTH_I2691 family protein [Pragia fontium]SFD50705.1 hypothetical protein SAMN02745723_1262 [Pragia fontium DSM 5563 = ATCC 49100]